MSLGIFPRIIVTIEQSLELGLSDCKQVSIIHEA